MRGENTLTCEHKDKCLECSRELRWFSKVSVEGHPLRSLINSKSTKKDAMG